MLIEGLKPCPNTHCCYYDECLKQSPRMYDCKKSYINNPTLFDKLYKIIMKRFQHECIDLFESRHSRVKPDDRLDETLW